MSFNFLDGSDFASIAFWGKKKENTVLFLLNHVWEIVRTFHFHLYEKTDLNKIFLTWKMENLNKIKTIFSGRHNTENQLSLLLLASRLS